MKKFLSNNIYINYIYFGFLFICLAFIHCYHVGILEQGSIALKHFFIFHVLLEVTFEISLFVLLTYLINNYLNRLLTYFFISATFLIFIAHIIEFPLVRIMDFSFWYVLEFVIQESFKNLMEMLYASHISFFAWILGIALAVFLIAVGLVFYIVSEKIITRKPLRLRFGSLAACCLIIPCLLVLVDHLTIRYSSPQVYNDYQKTLPCKNLFFSNKNHTLNLPGVLKKPKSEKEVFQLVNQNNHQVEKRPNIYFFVIESLREEFLSLKVAPNIAQFKLDNISTNLSLSNANTTQLSWFSLFYSKFPFYFNIIQPSNWSLGSPALQILKKMGYEIEIFSSVRLAYYQMQQLLFGEKLVKAYHLFPHDDEIQAYQSDEKTVSTLVKRIEEDNNEGGKCFIIFLESTHFGYSWPLQEATYFNPVANNINYLSITLSKQSLEKIKNRYRNAIFYIDGLFGKFVNSLKNSGKWEESVIVVTGDHGEEFYEEGHLFHASNLNGPQTEVPIYYKLGNNRLDLGQIAPQSSHIDIFPTIFHYLSKNEEAYSELFDGQSIFHSNRWPYIVSARYNASRSPYEFFIHNGFYKLVAQFENKREIYNSKALKILSIKNLSDEYLPYSMETVETNFDGAWEKIFSP